MTHETSFGRWIRENKDLDSSIGYCVSDQDYWVHKFKTFGNREFQCLMLVEIKTMGANLSLAQKDTLHTVNQVMRNRKQTPTKELKFQAGCGPLKTYSLVAKREITLRCYGMHVLTFSGLGPTDSDYIKWDSRNVQIDTLTKLLRFDLDPDSLNPIDLRNHHNPDKNQKGLPFKIAK